MNALVRKIICRITDCRTETTSDDERKQLVRSMDEIDERIDRLMERKRHNIIEQAIVARRREGES